MWLGEKITDKGIGNGISLLITVGIIASLPQAFFQEFTSRVTQSNGGGIITDFNRTCYMGCCYNSLCASWLKQLDKFQFNMLEEQHLVVLIKIRQAQDSIFH
jgi:preprotein translocase subunit SecY